MTWQARSTTMTANNAEAAEEKRELVEELEMTLRTEEAGAEPQQSLGGPWPPNFKKLFYIMYEY